MPSEPDLILTGFGVTDDLQLTVGVERLLTRRGRAFVLSPPPNLRKFLQSHRIDWTDLADRFAPGRQFQDAYLDVADEILRQCAQDPPVILLTQGNPLFLNSLNRYLVTEARSRGLAVRTYPGVSLLDVVLDYLGLDVGTYGLQLFDAGRLVERQQRVDPGVPLLVLQVAGFRAMSVAADDRRRPETYAPLQQYLLRFYSDDQLVSLLSLDEDFQGIVRRTAPLGAFAELAAHVSATSSLFFDAVR